MARVLVRYWAAARAAAGTAEEQHEAAVLGDVLTAAGDLHGDELRRVLARCSFLVDGLHAVPTTPLAEGSVVEVLPPFAGGSQQPCRERSSGTMRR